jgi:hypothetical protein
MGYAAKGRVDEGICRRDLAHYARANYVPVFAGLAFLLLKLTRMGSCRTATNQQSRSCVLAATDDGILVAASLGA